MWLPLALLALDWNMFRGPNGSGVSDSASAPVQFKLIWKTALPAGLSSPVFSGGRIYLTAAEGPKLSTIALDYSGKILWRRSVDRLRQEKLHQLNHAAAASPVTDGASVHAFFGDFGMVSYTAAGEERWRVPMGPFTNLYGAGSSPILADGKLILSVDQSKGSFIAAYDPLNGEMLWKTPRPEALSGHATPIVHGSTIILPGSFRMDGYDSKTGKSRWHVDGLPSEMKSIPVIDGGMLFLHGFNTPQNDPGRLIEIPEFKSRFTKAEAPTKHSAGVFEYIDLNGDGFVDRDEWDQYRRTMGAENALLAYKLGDTPVLKWKFQRSIPQLPSPLVYRDVVYMINEGGILTTLDAATGKLHKQARLRGVSDRYYASPVAADGKVYLASHTGVVSVLKAGPEQELLAAHETGDEVLATPAIVDGRVYLRGKAALYCFGDMTAPGQ